jgi:hypothetical protein
MTIQNLDNINFNTLNVYFLGGDEFLIMFIDKYSDTGHMGVEENTVADRNTLINLIFDGLKNNILTVSLMD